jgi:hypothetical protein
MPKSFSIWPPNNSGAIARLAVAVLALANLVAAWFVLRPMGGSPAELRSQVLDLRAQLHQKQGVLTRTKVLVSKIESGRDEGTDFLDDYFLPRRTAYSTVIAELNKAANDAKMKPKESALAYEEIEGSDTLNMMSISAGYEGTYQQLIQFINLLDKSDDLLIIEALNATPQQGSGLLNVTMKLDAFVREDGSAQ